MSPEELDLGKPWTEDGKTYFKIKGLQEFLVNRGFTKLSRPQIQQKIQDLNEGKESHTVFRFKDDGGKWHSARVWWVPEFVDQEIELPEGKVYEAPF